MIQEFNVFKLKAEHQISKNNEGIYQLIYKIIIIYKSIIY